MSFSCDHCGCALNECGCAEVARDIVTEIASGRTSAELFARYKALYDRFELRQWSTWFAEAFAQRKRLSADQARAADQDRRRRAFRR